MTSPFRISFILGILLIALSFSFPFILPNTAPYMPEHFRVPLFAFQFAESEAEVEKMFGPLDSEERVRMIEKMDRGNQLDFLYIVFYGLFLLFFGMDAAKTSGEKVFFAASVLAVAVMIGDVLENVQLFSITSKLGTIPFEDTLDKLATYTWLKWGGLAIIFLILGVYLMKEKGPVFTKIIGGLGVSMVLLVLIAYVQHFMIEPYCILANLMLFLLVGYAGWWQFRKH